MLVLSRKKNESIRIGDEIIIKVISVKGGGVRLGIDAPIEINIIRSELIPGMSSSEESNEQLCSSELKVSFTEGA